MGDGALNWAQQLRPLWSCRLGPGPWGTLPVFPTSNTLSPTPARPPIPLTLQLVPPRLDIGLQFVYVFPALSPSLHTLQFFFCFHPFGVFRGCLRLSPLLQCLPTGASEGPRGVAPGRARWVGGERGCGLRGSQQPGPVGGNPPQTALRVTAYSGPVTVASYPVWPS